MRAGLALAILATVIVAPGGWPAGAAAGLPPPPDAPPVLTVTLDATGKQASITESSPKNVTFDGVVTLDTLPREVYNVTLSCNVDTGWAYRCYPAYLIMNGGARYSFRVEVTVPGGTQTSIVGTVSVRANSTAYGYPIEATCEAKVSAEQYYRLMLDSKQSYIEAPPSTPATFTLSVTNAGNGPDDFRVELANRDHLHGQGWTVDIVPDTLTRVLPAECKTTEVTVNPPHEWVLWKSEPEVINIRVNSTGALSAQEVISITYPVYLYQKGADSLTLYSLMTFIVLGVLALSLWAVRRRRARRKRPAPAESGEPIDVEPD